MQGKEKWRSISPFLLLLSLLCVCPFYGTTNKYNRIEALRSFGIEWLYDMLCEKYDVRHKIEEFN